MATLETILGLVDKEIEGRSMSEEEARARSRWLKSLMDRAECINGIIFINAEVMTSDDEIDVNCENTICSISPDGVIRMRGDMIFPVFDTTGSRIPLEDSMEKIMFRMLFQKLGETVDVCISIGVPHSVYNDE